MDIFWQTDWHTKVCPTAAVGEGFKPSPTIVCPTILSQRPPQTSRLHKHPSRGTLRFPYWDVSAWDVSAFAFISLCRPQPYQPSFLQTPLNTLCPCLYKVLAQRTPLSQQPPVRPLPYQY